MRRLWWVIVALLTCVVLALAFARPPSGPTYQGRSLASWLRCFEGGELPQTRYRAAEAVRGMGTNIVPLLVSQLSHPRARLEPPWRHEIRGLLSRLPVLNILPFPADDRSEALAALDALGPNAQAALPALEGLLHENPPDQRALLVIVRIGPEGVPVLTSALTNDERIVRVAARTCFDMMPSNSPVLFPRTLEQADFLRRNVQFNLMMMGEALKEYRAQHPDEFSQDAGNQVEQ